jgi:PKD repeat protein
MAGPADPRTKRNVRRSLLGLALLATVLVACDINDPGGSLDSVTVEGNRITVRGWVVDLQALASPVSVHIYANGSVVKGATANVARLDVFPNPGPLGPNHGFASAFTLPKGTYEICVFGINVGLGTNNPVGCQTVTVTGNSGFAYDAVSSPGPGLVRVQGWAMNGGAATLVETRLNGVVVNSRKTGAGAAAPAQYPHVNRPDVTSALNALPGFYGFDLEIDAPIGVQSVCTRRVSAAWSCKNVAVANSSPTAHIAANPTSGSWPLDVEFDGAASSDVDGTIVAFDWDFGDGASSSTSAPSHQYSGPGSYLARLTVSDDRGATGVADVTIVVGTNAAPNAVLGATPTSGNPSLTVAFDSSSSFDSDGSVDSYSWDFGDGGSSTAASPSHQYNSAGSFLVTLTVTDDLGASGIATQTIVVNQAPTASFTSATVGDALGMAFDSTGSVDPDGSIVSYAWDFGDGGASAAANPAHGYASPGLYTVQLTVTDNQGLTHLVAQSVRATRYDVALRVVGSLAPAVQAAFDSAEAKWETIITDGIGSWFPNISGEPLGTIPAGDCLGGAPQWSGTIDDVVIDVAVRPIDGVGNILGQAGPCYWLLSDELPRTAMMEFDVDDVAGMISNGTLESVVLHEMGHVLGFGTMWEGGSLVRDLLDGTGGASPTYTGAGAVAEYATLGGSGDVPVAGNAEPSGTADAHWDEPTFDKELMTGFIDMGGNPTSRMTIAAMADLGYTVDLAQADAYSLPPPPVLFPGLRAAPIESGVMLRPTPRPAP